MSKVPGSFTLPNSQRTSQLINDARFSSIREYVLNSESLSGSTQLDIADLPANAVIYMIELCVLSAFNNLNGDQHNIAVTCDNGGVIMDSTWNDPTMVGTYVTDCYCSIRGNEDLVHVIHNLSNISSGAAVLRLHIYTHETDTYSTLQTSEDETYLTENTQSIDIGDY